MAGAQASSRREWALAVVVGVLWLLAASLPTHAACPDATTAAKGVKLTHASGRFLEVTRHDGDVVHYREQVGPAAVTARDITSFRGVLGLSSEGPGERNEIVWAGGPAALFPLKAGSVHELDFLVKSSKGTERKAHLRLEIGSAMIGLAVGSCGYEVWPLKREVVFLDTGMKVVGTDYWSPVLSIYLRRDTVAHIPGKAPAPFNLTYDAIEARP